MARRLNRRKENAMTTDPAWLPADVDATKPSIARIYDHHLGGTFNFPADREAAAQVTAMLPELPDVLRANRAFLRRCVRFLADSGIRNFLDLGSGIPTVGNVHEIAQQADPTARVVYVDYDPVAVAHSRTILAGNDRATVVQADLRDPVGIMNDPEVRRLLLPDLGEPIALLLSAVLHFIPDDAEATRVVAGYRDLLPSGSYIAISHGGRRPQADQRIDDAAQAYSQTVAPVKVRSMAQVTEFFTGLELVEPGVVYCERWRPDSTVPVSDDDVLPQIGGVARLA
jgi:SAM-dependent methyltransferase